MSRQNHLLHHHISNKKRLTGFDKTVVAAAFLYPMSGIPQLKSVLEGNISGVSLTSWIGFIAFSLLFLVYGVVHKVRPTVITNSLWLCLDGLIVIGILSHTVNA